MPVLMDKALYTIRNESFGAFLRRGLLFLRHRVYFHRKYFMFANKLAETSREYAVPQIERLSLKIVPGRHQYEELTSAGFVFRPWRPEYTKRLDNGATAFCAFDGKKLIHVSWCATTRAAMKAIGEPPYRVDFENNEVANGDLWTHPDYRGKGVAHYTVRMRQQYLRENGVVTTRGVIPLDNRESLRVPRSGRSKVYAIGSHVRVLWWENWKETPYTASDDKPYK